MSYASVLAAAPFGIRQAVQYHLANDARVSALTGGQVGYFSPGHGFSAPFVLHMVDATEPDPATMDDDEPAEAATVVVTCFAGTNLAAADALEHVARAAMRDFCGDIGPGEGSGGVLTVERCARLQSSDAPDAIYLQTEGELSPVVNHRFSVTYHPNPYPEP